MGTTAGWEEPAEREMSQLGWTRFPEVIYEHDRRRALVAHLRERPGATLPELAAALHVDYKTALHHARMLERARQVVLARHGRALHLYLPGESQLVPPGSRALDALHAVAAGCATPATLARALGVPRGSAGRLLDRLVGAGLLEATPDGLAPTERVRKALAPREGFS